MVIQSLKSKSCNGERGYFIFYYDRRKRKDSAVIEEDGPSDREEFLPGQAKTDFNRKPKIGKITKIIAGLSLHSGRLCSTTYVRETFH